MMIKISKFTAMIGMTVALCFPISANADSLSDAFNDIATSVVDAGIYKSRTRTAVTLGSFSARFGQTSYQLFSYTPPRLSAGCGGIDAHFGGFSFINNIDFQQLVANIGQNALGLVIHLAMKVGCEPCQTVLSQIQEWAQFAASLSIDSCLAAKSGLQWLQNTTDLCQVFAGREAYADNQSEDAAAAVKTCRKEVSSYDSYQKQYGQKANPSGTSAEAPDQVPKELCKAANDLAWCTLTNAGVLPTYGNPDATGGIKPKHISDADNDEERRRIGWGELFRAIAMQNRTAMDPTKETTRGQVSQIPDPKTFTYDFYRFALCGTAMSTNALVNEISGTYCIDIWDKADTSMGEFVVPTCGGDISVDRTDYEHCYIGNDLGIREWASSRAFFQQEGGMIGQIIEALLSIRTKVQTRQELSESEMAIISQAPVPLYQLFNLSSVYPGIADEFLGSSSLLMADMITTQFFLNNLSSIAQKVDADNVNVDGLEIIRNAIQEFSVPFKNGEYTFHGDDARANRLAFQKEVLNTVEMYQRLLVREIADSQIGANISATNHGFGKGGTN